MRSSLNRGLGRTLLCAVGAAAIASALFAQERASAGETRRLSGYRPLAMFNQHLYLGTFSRPRGLAFDAKRSELWIADTGNGTVSVHRLNGMELYAFSSATKLVDPVRVAIAPNGDVLVIEGDRSVVRRFNYRGEYKSDVPLPGMDAKPIIGAVAFGADGMLYVAENHSAQVFAYDPEGKLKFQFGSRGSDEGQFMSVCSIAIGPAGELVIADQIGLAVQLFDSQGNFLRGWGKHEMGGEHFSLPSGLAIDGRGHILVSDELRHQVKVFTMDGKLLMNIGGLGDGAGQFSFPTDIVATGDRIYVSERATSRVQVIELTYAE